MENDKNKQLSRVFFYISYTILVIKTIWEKLSIVQSLKNYLTIFEFLLLIICILLQERKYKYKTVFLMLIPFSIIIYSYSITKNYNIIILILSVFAVKNIDIKSLIKYDIKMKVFLLISNIFFIFIGIIPNIVLYRDVGIPRYTLGFSSPNSFGGIVFSICLESIYLNYEKIGFFSYVKLFLVIIMLDIICASRSVEICLVILMILIPIYKNKIRLKKFIPYIMISYTIISFFLVYLYGEGNSIAIKLDILFSTRLKCAYNFLNLYNINLFGNFFEEVEGWIGYVNTLDNGYIYLMLNQGIFIYIIIAYYNILLMKNTIKNKNNILIVVLIVLYTYGLMERGVFFIVYNIFLLYIKDIIYKREMGKEEISRDEKKGINKYNSTNI